MIVCLSASHKKASLPMLESLNVPDENETMKTLCAEGSVQECIFLQTCHRVEIYCVMEDSAQEDVVNRILKLWSAKAGVSLDLLKKIVEFYQGREALIHLFNLTAGLESVVLGEDQVLGQVRSAYVKAKKLGTVKLILGKVFMKAVNTSRRVKTETKVNEGSVSISSAAVDCAEKELGNLKSVRALLIGAGEAGAITAENLRKRGTRTILVANRTYERGLELASKVAGKAIKFDRMYEVLPKVDLVIAAVSVSEPVLKANQIRRVLAKDRGARRLVVIDISQPRAVEEKVGLLPGVSLRNIDDLKEIVEDCIKTRQIEAEKAEKIIFEELERFERQLSRFLVEPVISEIFRRNEEIRRKELERAIRKIGESDKRKCVIIDRFSRELVERIMQLPIEELREAALQNDGTLLSAAEKLFRVRREKTV